jgi:hypothetical protein
VVLRLANQCIPGDKKLVIARYYFWKPATVRLQKSLEGLRRRILFNVLCSSPKLISILFPAEWKSIQSHSAAYAGSESSIRSDAVNDGFMRLIKTEEVQHKYRFCFFIDALDEHEEIPLEDNKEMVKMLRK